MVIKQRLSLLRILRTTWKVDILLIITCIATYYLHEFVLTRAIQLPPTLSTLLGTAIAFFVGFNNNQAYDRWWEARTIWGALVNDSRTWARNVLVHTGKGTPSDSEALHAIRTRMIYRQIGFVYALKETLRRKPDGYFEKYLSPAEVKRVRQESNIANAILTQNAADLQQLSEQGLVDQFRFYQLNDLVKNFTDHMGRSERIRNTIFPTTYVYFTRLFIWVLVVFTSMILADAIGAWSIFVGWIIGFVFHVTHQNGMALMDPFDETPAGVPLNQISRTIEINLLQMMGAKDIPEPVQPINNEYVL